MAEEARKEFPFPSNGKYFPNKMLNYVNLTTHDINLGFHSLQTGNTFRTELERLKNERATVSIPFKREILSERTNEN